LPKTGQTPRNKVVEINTSKQGGKAKGQQQQIKKGKAEIKNQKSQRRTLRDIANEAKRKVQGINSSYEDRTSSRSVRTGLVYEGEKKK